MNDDQQPDPTATFRLDQEAAQTEAQTRDQVGWELHVKDAAATVRMKDQAARLEGSKADMREAVTLAIYAGVSIGGTWAVVEGIQAVIGWFQ